jgi:hypothetical protein
VDGAISRPTLIGISEFTLLSAGNSSLFVSTVNHNNAEHNNARHRAVVLRTVLIHLLGRFFDGLPLPLCHMLSSPDLHRQQNSHKKVGFSTACCQPTHPSIGNDRTWMPVPAGNFVVAAIR